MLPLRICFAMLCCTFHVYSFNLNELEEIITKLSRLIEILKLKQRQKFCDHLNYSSWYILSESVYCKFMDFKFPIIMEAFIGYVVCCRQVYFGVYKGHNPCSTDSGHMLKGASPLCLCPYVPHLGEMNAFCKEIN